MEPYYSDDWVTLYHGDCRKIDLPIADAIITDPPYGETALEWDLWPSLWPQVMSHFSKAMWCFGSFRMFMENSEEFQAWKFSHEIVWEKHNGSGFATDKFRRVHELAAFFYQGAWSEVHHEVPRIPSGVPNKGGNHRRVQGQHTGKIASSAWSDDGLRLQKSVIHVPSMQNKSLHPTQKPNGIVAPLIEYSVPVGGLVIDPFAGSGTTLEVARLMGRRSVGVEAREEYCEIIAARLSQQAFDFGSLVSSTERKES